jgi:hypothetical protein
MDGNMFLFAIITILTIFYVFQFISVSIEKYVAPGITAMRYPKFLNL